MHSFAYGSDGFVTVTLPALRALGTVGSGDAVIAGGPGGKGDLSLATSGSGDIRWTGEATTLSVSTSGRGTRGSPEGPTPSPPRPPGRATSTPASSR